MVNKSQKVLYVIEKLADIDFQQEAWIQNKYWNEIESFVDATNILEEYHFFDDVEQNKIGLVDYEWKEVNSFVSKLLEYDSQQDEKYTLFDMNWIVITNEAKIIFEILKKYKW